MPADRNRLRTSGISPARSTCLWRESDDEPVLESVYDGDDRPPVVEVEGPHKPLNILGRIKRQQAFIAALAARVVDGGTLRRQLTTEPPSEGVDASADDLAYAGLCS